ncbi:hypothetical protein DINM_000288 [Dirofilaria immitis]|nr:hypothetical protein [Dirofilaria immitis]
MASSSRESGACQRDSTIYQNCSYRCIYNCQKNLTTTFQSRSDDIWQTRKSYYEEEVVIVLRDEVECIGFSMDGVIPGNHGVIINSILAVPGYITSVQKKSQEITIPGYVIFVATVQQKQQVILFGSPANKAGLQIGDHIVEINGCTTEGKNYAQIVELIHQVDDDDDDDDTLGIYMVIGHSA